MFLRDISLQDIFPAAGSGPIISSLLDTDAYKWTMSAFIYGHQEYRDVSVKFQLIVRDKRIKLAEVIPESELRYQLDQALGLCLKPAEASFLRGMTLSDGKRLLRSDEFLNEFSRPVLSPYSLSRRGEDYVLSAEGPWWSVTFWEIIFLTIVSELYYYHLISRSGLSTSEIMAIYTAMVARLTGKVMKLRTNPALSFILFDTRRRHSGYMQDLVMRFMTQMLPGQCLGTSNVLLAMRHGDDNPKGTNAHELPMVEGCLAGDDRDRIFQSPITMAQKWFDYYGQDLSILLPDTYGTKHFLRHAPASFARDHKGIRPDSMEPNKAIDIFIEWWESHGVDPRTKMVLPSDGLDADPMLECSRRNAERLGILSYGWGTLAGNDCRGLWPRNDATAELFRPFSMACKVIEADGIPAVKLSDNPEKATGPADRVERFKGIFGEEGMKRRLVTV